MARKSVLITIPKAKVVIVDDHPAVREALAIRVAAQSRLEICGEASEIVEALQVISRTKPDVVVIDIALKGANGINLIKRLKESNADVRMIVWSMFQEEVYAERALRAGAMGYLTKERAPSEIVDAIHQILEGRIYLSAVMSEKLVQQSLGKAIKRRAVELLTDRELEVFHLIGQGLDRRAIGAQLHLDLKRVQIYRDQIREKMSFKDSRELKRSAREWFLNNMK